MQHKEGLTCVEAKEPLYKGRGWLHKEESFVITGKVPPEVPKH